MKFLCIQFLWKSNTNSGSRERVFYIGKEYYTRYFYEMPYCDLKVYKYFYLISYIDCSEILHKRIASYKF
ncbi:hypothetical protein QVD17_42471 [Tagetes erecta]|uniref:Uncharacterized protein n=1 Tax=Tagetes erecta TaxID=13708 RepID=A0AAD8JM78_TARER|nr:hypothetical protein QVD17_42471 [Tagetes erecta]